MASELLSVMDNIIHHGRCVVKQICKMIGSETTLMITEQMFVCYF